MITGLDYLRLAAIPGAYALLPARMRSPAATAMLLTIALQESRCMYRVQLDNGPAHGLWQFERGGGCYGVLTHPVTADILRPLCREAFHISATPQAVWEAIVHNDILAAICARLLLYTAPDALPGPSEAKRGWDQYVSTWRPGKPHPETWDNFYTRAWGAVGDPHGDR